MLVTNQQRFEKICEILNKGTGSPTERLLESAGLVREIETYRFVQEKGLTYDQLIGTAKLAAETYFGSSPSDEPAGIMNVLESLANVDSGDHYEALALIEQLHDNWSFPLISEVQKIVFSLILSVRQYTFMYYYDLVQKNKVKVSS